MRQPDGRSVHERWAHLRYAAVGQLLADPPPKGQLRAHLRQLAARTWRHPISGEPVRFGVSTLERWFHRARRERRDPVGVLRRKVRKDLGFQHSVSEAVRAALLQQYAAHPHWSAQLHYLNVCALMEGAPHTRVPSYATVRRFMAAQGLSKQRRLSSRRTEGAGRAQARLLEREVRSYEAEYVGGLWHWDAHVCSRKILSARGEWVTPILFGVLDDRSRLICHLQWYRGPESAQSVVHGLSQAFMKRGLPRTWEASHVRGCTKPLRGSREFDPSLRSMTHCDLSHFGLCCVSFASCVCSDVNLQKGFTDDTSPSTHDRGHADP